MVGVARYGVQTHSPQIAEWTIIVADAYQGQGVACLLLGQLADHAKLAGIEVMHAVFQQDNDPSQQLTLKAYGEPDHTTKSAGQLEWKWNINDV